MKALVTGGAGFIGHHLTSALVRRGDSVVVVDSLLTGSRERLRQIEPQVTFWQVDVRDRSALREAMTGIDTVFHLAALPSVQRSVADPVLTNDINAGGTVGVMEAAARAGVRRVVVSGSSSVYGSGPGLPRSEDQSPDPQSPYAVSKLATEHYALTLGRLRDVDVVVLRYFNVFGPGQDPNSEYAAVVPRFVTAVLSGAPPIINGDGHQSRDFTYVDNVVSANILGAETPAADGGVFNIGCGERHSVLDLLDAISTAAGRDASPTFVPDRPGDVRDSQADISRAQTVLGYRPLIGFTEGIKKTVDHYRLLDSTP